jgi:hypothetical protein
MNQLHDFVRQNNNNKIYFINIINDIDNNNANWTDTFIYIKKIEFKCRIYFLYLIIQTLFCLFIALYRYISYVQSELRLVKIFD